MGGVGRCDGSAAANRRQGAGRQRHNATRGMRLPPSSQRRHASNIPDAAAPHVELQLGVGHLLLSSHDAQVLQLPSLHARRDGRQRRRQRQRRRRRVGQAAVRAPEAVKAREGLRVGHGAGGEGHGCGWCRLGRVRLSTAEHQHGATLQHCCSPCCFRHGDPPTRQPALPPRLPGSPHSRAHLHPRAHPTPCPAPGPPAPTLPPGASTSQGSRRISALKDWQCTPAAASPALTSLSRTMEMGS